jgi:hypothetical protein
MIGVEARDRVTNLNAVIGGRRDDVRNGIVPDAIGQGPAATLAPSMVE